MDFLLRKDENGSSPQADLVYIRIRQSLLRPIPTSASSPPDQTSSESISAGHLYVVAGTLDDISHYAGNLNTADWIIRVARLIFDPLGTGRVYTHTTGTSSDWLTLDKTSDWQVVAPGDPLLSKVYEFDSDHPITPSRICERHNRSQITMGSRSSASTFQTQINLRDGDQCVVSEINMYPATTHLIPKRLGTKISDIVTRFSGEQAALGIHCFDPRIGIRLTLNMDNMVNNYQLGFYHIMGNSYMLHSMNTADLSRTGFPRSHDNDSTLHRHIVTFSAHDIVPLPLKGAFDWHYIQCIIKKFGTAEYRAIANIRFVADPFKTDSDYSDNECDDTEPPWLTYNYDKFRAEQERKSVLSEWASLVPTFEAGTDEL